MAFINRAPLKPREVVHSTGMLRPKEVAGRLRKLMAENEKDEPPRAANEDVTMTGDPLIAMMPIRRIYPHKDMVQGNGGGPLIHGSTEVIT
jgi:hypothetical protein